MRQRSGAPTTAFKPGLRITRSGPLQDRVDLSRIQIWSYTMTLGSTKGRTQRMSGTTSNKSRGDDTPCDIWMGKAPIFCDLVQGKQDRKDLGRRHNGRNIPLYTRLAVRRRSLLLGLILGTLKSRTGSARQSTPLSKREEPKTTIQVTRLRSVTKQVLGLAPAIMSET